MTTPPTAASMGRAAWRGTLSCPTSISHLSSMPTSKKNRVMRPSFTKASTVIDLKYRPKWKPSAP